MSRFTIIIICCLIAEPLAAADFDSDIRPLLQAHCFKCHGPDKQENDLRLDTLTADFSNAQTAGTWIEVRDNINLGEMPPDGESKPTAEQQVMISKWIHGELRSMQAKSNSTGGRVQLRRLTRTEYLNTVRDLLKVTFVEGESPRDILPPDGTIDGFDKLSKALLLDPSLMENYFAAAKLVADRAVRVKPPRVPTMKARTQLEERPSRARSVVNTKTGLLVYRGNVRTGPTVLRHPYARLVDPYGNGQFPSSGKYAIRVRAGADRGSRTDEPVFMDISWTRGQKKRFEVTAPISQPAVYEWILDVDTNESGEINVVLVNGTQFSTGYRTSYNVHAAISKAQDAGDIHAANRARSRGRAEGFYDANYKDAPTFDTRDMSNLPRLYLDWVELQGPLQETFPPASTRHIFHDGFSDPAKHTREYARSIVARILPRAFRRPVTNPEIDAYAKLAADELARGNSFARAVKASLVAILCSPDFLYLLEPDADGRNTPAPRNLNSYELASRLSYFLWSSMPDDQLLAKANAGELADPATLDAEVVRMLADPKSEALVQDFANQWLRVSEFSKFIPDEQIYKAGYYAPEFGGIGPDMEQEAFAFFREVLRQDESVLNFVDSRWVMVNERLAKYYGIDGVRGEQFRRVALPAGSPRGGILGMAGIHKWGSDGNRTKPVERGKYILTVLFNDPPDPPPPNAGEVEPNVGSEIKTVRDRLLAHQQVAACAGCHRTIDPYGLAMENFNAVGQWRDKQDGEKPNWGNNAPPIINEGTLPNGKAYGSFAEFKSLMREQGVRFERGLAEKLWVYALGRTIEPTDDAILGELVAGMATSGHTLKGLIRGIVKSRAFRTKWP